MILRLQIKINTSGASEKENCCCLGSCGVDSSIYFVCHSAKVISPEFIVTEQICNISGACTPVTINLARKWILKSKNNAVANKFIWCRALWSVRRRENTAALQLGCFCFVNK
jgi:hypothetical protein